MSDQPLAPFDAAVAGLLSQVAPAERRALARRIARQLRASQAERIAAQRDPDGTGYAPRKPQLRHKRGQLRRKMFGKLRTAKYLKTQATEATAVVAFAANVQRIARVHQYGLRDRVNRRGGAEVAYPARRLLGLTDAEITSIEDAVLSHLAGDRDGSR